MQWPEHGKAWESGLELRKCAESRYEGMGTGERPQLGSGALVLTGTHPASAAAHQHHTNLYFPDHQFTAKPFNR